MSKLCARFAYIFAALYAFPWLRFPDVAGVALPLQRLLGFMSVPLLFIVLALRRSVSVGKGLKLYLSLWLIFMSFIFVSLLVNKMQSPFFDDIRAVAELSKYIAVFATSYFIYFTLKNNYVRFEIFRYLLMYSGIVSVGLTYLFLGLYWLGFRTENEILAPSFGNNLAVLPTGSFLPRLAGTGAEPQQLSVLFLTSLFIMLTPQYFRRYWFVALLGVGALILSQSKFAVVSLGVLAIFLYIIYGRQRLSLIALGLLLIPITGGILSNFSAFAELFERGVEAGAIAERLDNTELLVSIIKENWMIGVGVGQYGPVRSAILYDDPNQEAEYFANNDFLTFFAEIGIFGFILGCAILSTVVHMLFYSMKLSREKLLVFLPYLFGAIAITLNMLIGYEFLHSFFWINIGVLLYLRGEWSGVEK
ncbi:MAG: O-antigen ligase family protein [Trueperaceae bacterium]